MESKRESSNCVSSIPQRYITVFLTFLTVIGVGMIVNSLPIILTQITKPILINETEWVNTTFGPMEYSCPEPDIDARQVNRTTQLKMPEHERYAWSEEMQGIILGSYYVGYVLMHIPGAMLAQRFSGQIVLVFTLGCAAVLTLLTPLAIEMGGAHALIAIRALIGTCQGGLWPALSAIMAIWVPLNERGSLGAFVFSGISSGSIVGNLIAGFLLDYSQNWRLVFYLYGTIGVILATLYFFLSASSPSTHPFITEKEKAYLMHHIGQLERDKNAAPTPWRAIFTSVPVIALIVDKCCGDFAYYVAMNNIPKYMNDVLHVRVSENGVYSSLPWILRLATAFLCGIWADWLIKTERLSVTSTRKLLTVIAAILDGFFLLAAGYAGCDPMLVGFFFMIAVASRGFLTSSTLLNPIDLSPNYAATIAAISNGCGSVLGFLVPLLVAWVTPNSLLPEWRIVFWITFFVEIFKIVNFTSFGSGEVQPWNEPKRPSDQEMQELGKLTANNRNKIDEID